MNNTKVTLQNKQLLILYRGLHAVKELKGSRFAILVAKNMKEIKAVLDPLDEQALPSVEFQELSVKMQKLIEQEDTEQIEKLEEENKELIDARKKQLEEVNDALEKETEVYIYKIREDQLPDEITGEQLEPLLEILE
jgi:hypothetical protein